MPSRFPIGTVEVAWTRRMLCAAEVVDAVTLAPVTTDIEVRAEGLKRKPYLNRSGIHYWLEEGTAQPQRIVVTPLDTQYSNAEVAPPTPPQKSVRIELAPLASYAFPPGATASRGTIIGSRFGTPEPVTDANIRLQWSEDGTWYDAPTEVRTDHRGEFAAPLRLAPKSDPDLTDGAIDVRLRVRRGVTTRTSDKFALKAGQVSSVAAPFVWNDLHP